MKITDFKYNSPLTTCFECNNSQSGKQNTVNSVLFYPVPTFTFNIISSEI